MLARRGAGLVHRAGAADEQRDATRPEAGDRAGDEVVVEPQAERGRGGVGTDDAVRERRIADHQVEAAGEIAAGVILAADAGFRVDEAGNPGGHRIVFDAGELRCAAQGVGQQGEEQAGAHARLEHAAAGEAEAFSGVPQRPDNALGRVVGVLRRTLQGRIFGGRHRVGEITTDLRPSRRGIPSLRAAESSSGRVRWRRSPRSAAVAPALQASAHDPQLRSPSTGGSPRYCRVRGRPIREQARGRHRGHSCCRSRPARVRAAVSSALASCKSAASAAGTLAGACTLVPRPVLSNRARVNCAASGISLSDGERPRAPSFARCVVAVVI